MAFVIKKEFLKGMKTRFLLKVLRKSCVNQEQLNSWYGWKPAPDAPDPVIPLKADYEKKALVPSFAFGYEDYVESEVTLADLKAELSTREHVPNKIEAKALRKAKNKENRGKGRRNR